MASVVVGNRKIRLPKGFTEEEVKEEVKAAEEVVQEVKEELPPPPAEPVVEGKLYCFFITQ